MIKKCLSLIFLILHISVASLAKTFKPLEYDPTPIEIVEWRRRCEAKKPSSNDCYNYATYLAQNLKEETTSLKFYEKSCKLKHGLACLGLGAIYVKYKRTRKRGIEKLNQACYLPDSFDSPKHLTLKSCELSKIVSDHQSLSWIEIYQRYIKPNP